MIKISAQIERSACGETVRTRCTAKKSVTSQGKSELVTYVIGKCPLKQKNVRTRLAKSVCVACVEKDPHILCSNDQTIVLGPRA